MAFQLVSDLHLETMRDYGKTLLDEIIPSDDILIVAGDLCNAMDFNFVLTQLCGKYREVIFILGNHEHYFNSFKDVDWYISKLKIKNLHILRNDIIELDGVKIAGTTMWFKDDPMNVCYQRKINDFAYIREFVNQVYIENKRAVKFIRSLKNIDMVVTHYVPSRKAIAPIYKGFELNRFFICDMEEDILKIKPKYWLFGHTHFSYDFKIGETRLLSNPRGYELSDLNKKFRKLTINLDGK